MNMNMNNMNFNYMDPMTFNMMLNMMNVMHPNMGFNMNNYNYNMMNNQNGMNLMMNWMNANPNLVQTYQNMSNQVNNSQNKMNFVNVSRNEARSGGIFKNNMPNNISIDASSPYDNSPKVNIILNTMKGHKTNIIASYNMKVKDLLLLYVQKLGLGPAVMGDSLFFLFNGQKIDINEERTVYDLSLHNGGQIVVLDIKGVIGA